MLLAAVDHNTHYVLQRLQRDAALPPEPDAQVYFLELDQAGFDALEVTRHPQGGGYCWQAEAGDIVAVPDTRNVVTVSMPDGTVAAVGEPITFVYQLTDSGGYSIPVPVTGLTRLRRSNAPDIPLRSTIENGEKTFSRAFAEPGDYTLNIEGVLMKGDTRFTIIEDV
ncbi:MAG: hypothetical protein ACPGVG_00495 [Mycobacterium sp.]